MVNGKYKYTFIPVSFITTLYIIFLIYDANLNKAWESLVTTQANNIEKNKETDGLILGGSNVFYSISAEQISSFTSQNWIGAAIPSEGHTDNNYWEFIKENTNIETREKISKIIYSPVTLMGSNQSIKNRNRTNINYRGHPTAFEIKNIIKPNQSLAGHIKNISAQNSRKNRNTSAYGDLDFSTLSCNFTANQIRYERTLSKRKLQPWLFSQLETIHFLFPHSTVALIVPSMYYGSQSSSETDSLQNQLITEAVELYNSESERKIILIFNEYYPSIDMICDASHHANEVGRNWRTKHLLEQLIDSNFIEIKED